MSLRSQITSLLIVLSIGLVAGTYAVEVVVVMPAFAKLEQQGAEQDVDRCLAALHRDIESLSNTANDWGAWDDTYQYIQDHNQAYAESNLTDEVFSGVQ